MLSAHKNIYCIPYETNTFTNWEIRNSKTHAMKFYRIYRHILKTRIPRGTTRWCEKTPTNVRFFGNILEFFQGKVSIIHIIRDGRDVVCSVHPDAQDKYWVPVERWVNDVQQGLHFQHEENVLNIKYKDLVLNNKKTLENICAFLEIEYSTEIENWVAHTAKKRDPAWLGEVRELHSESIGKWKKDRHSRRIAEFYANKKAVKLLETIGYR